MCRWLAYSGSPLVLEELLFKPTHSLIVQSMHAQLSPTPISGDGFGIGWFGERDLPALFHSTSPAWNDRNLRELSGQLKSSLIFAHVRSSTGTAVQQTNCHPFRYGRWLWMHNGYICEFARVKRELALAVEPRLYPLMEGSTDSELFFYLALTFGLEDDPPRAVALAAGFIETLSRERGIEYPLQMTVATTNGSSVWVFRYSSEHRSRTLFYSSDMATLRKLYPDNMLLQALSDETRLVVSEPLGELPGIWNEMDESSYGVIQEGEDFWRPFIPAQP